MSKHYPFHADHTRTHAFVRNNYYGSDPYDTLDAARMRERIYRVTARAMVLRTTSRGCFNPRFALKDSK